MAEEEAPIFDPTMKKKKKKVKKKFDLDEELEGGEDEQGVAQEQTNVEAQTDATEGTAPEPKVPEAPEPEASDKGVKKTVKFAEGEVEEKDDEEEDDGLEIKYEEPRAMKYSDANATWLDSERDYTYDELLERVFNIMRERNPDIDSGGKRKFVMKPPQVLRVGTKKTSFANFKEICRLLRRDPRHLLAFLLAELGTSGSVDGNDQLIIKGRFQQKQIESILRHYIKEYVTCHTCKSPETRLEKEERLFFLQCEVCQSRCSVASIKSGFQAVTARRAQMRARVA